MSPISRYYHIFLNTAPIHELMLLSCSLRRRDHFTTKWKGLANIRQKQLTQATTVTLLHSLIVLSRADEAFSKKLKIF